MSNQSGSTSNKRSARCKYAVWWSQTFLLASQLMLDGNSLSANPGNPLVRPAAGLLNFHMDGYIDHGTEGSVTTETSFKILTDAEVTQAGKYQITYDSHLLKLSILEAYTEKPDGTRIPVNLNDIVLQTGIAGRGSATSFADVNVEVVPFPRVAKGDTLKIRYRQSGDISPLEGMISAVTTATGPANRLDVRMTMDVPDKTTFHTDLKGFSEQITRHGERTLYKWGYTGAPSADTNTYGAVDAMTSIPHVYASTIADYDTFGHIYWQNAKAPTTPNARTQALAKDITKGHTDPHEQAMTIYNWMHAHIRYVASYTGMGAWVPRTADDVLSTGYGDCKDQAALFQALLRSVGIDSDPVLLMADQNNYALPSAPVLDAFNHVITYLPSLNLYADTTAPEVPFGALPYVDTGKPVLLAGERVGLTRTPLADIPNVNEVRSTHVTVQADGSAQVETVLTTFGVAANELRARARALGASGDGKWINASIHTGWYNGNADYAFRLPPSPGEPAREWVRMRVTRFLQGVRGALSLADVPAAMGFVIVNDADFNNYRPLKRSQPYWCAPRQLEEHITINFPNTVTVMPPANADISGEGISWHATYVTTPHQLTATRMFRIDSAQMDCPATEYPRQKAIVDRIVANFAQQAVYLPTSERNQGATVSR